jgi:large subunit ribosomal protein L13
MAKDKEEGKQETKKTAKAPTEKKVEAADKTGKKAAKPKVERTKLVPKTYFAKPGELGGDWKVVDATGQALGRLSSQVATMLMGKNKPTFTRSSDTGDNVIVINASKVVLTGKKLSDKLYHHHTGYPGGIKTQTASEIMEKHPERLIEKAVYGMLPKGHMGRHWFKKLRVFAGAEHPHIAQQPKPITLAEVTVKEGI